RSLPVACVRLRLGRLSASSRARNDLGTPSFPPRRPSDIHNPPPGFGADKWSGMRLVTAFTSGRSATSFDALEVIVDNDRAANDLDRKSTRLNSSHGSISYAVFCLEKSRR